MICRRFHRRRCSINSLAVLASISRYVRTSEVHAQATLAVISFDGRQTELRPSEGL